MADGNSGSRLYLKKEADAITFKVHVQPRSSKNRVVGLWGDALKIKLTAPPVDGSANAMCLKFLSDLLKVPKSAFHIISGKSGRQKKIRLTIPDRSEIKVVIKKLHGLIDAA